MRRIRNICLVILPIMMVLVGLFWLMFMNPYRGSLTKPGRTVYPPDMEKTLAMDAVLSEKQAVQDLKQAHRLIRTRHPVWLRDPAKAEQTDAAFASVIKTIGSVTVEELQNTISACISHLEDPNTAVRVHFGQKSDVQNNDPGFVSSSIDSEQGVGFFTLRSCVVNEVFGSTLEQFFQKMTEQQIPNLVLDLRGNNGGNPDAALLFLEYLDVDSLVFGSEETRKGLLLQKQEMEGRQNNKRVDAYAGTVFVLTDRQTAGSALLFAELLADNELAVHIGEAPATNPDHYGDLLCFRLKHSGLQLDVPHKHYGRIDTTKTDLPLIPDVYSEDPIAEVLAQIEKGTD